MNKPTVLRDFKSLPRALAESPKPVAASFVVYDDDDLPTCIWRLLSDRRPRTAHEISVVFNQTEWKIAAISMQLRRFANEGMLESISTGSSAFTTYTLKKGMEMPVETTTNKTVRKFDSNIDPIQDTRGSVKAADGIDLCLWKATSDRRYRTCDQIAAILGEYGFNRGLIKDRVIFLAHKGWYERTGKGKQTKYALKKHVAMPASEAPVAAELLEKESSANTVHARPEIPATSLTQQAVAMESITHVYRKEDGPHLNIWKAMSDFREYTAADVGTLLAEIGFNEKSIGVAMGVLWKKRNWFVRRHITGSKAYAYTLRPEIPMPESLASQFAREDAEQAKAAAVETEPVIESKEPEMKTAIVNATATPPLFDFTLKLKGMDFNLNEARQLTRDLSEYDFEPNVPVGLIDVSIKIKGMPFTTEELRTVQIKLVEAGFDK